ncbi:PREDICTED: uncharacterized protein LOC108361069 [Rhagoletis zephyria]|uniref:uncharacterized protein LOC108361069 n=1 Tax=Rhagoletis zephyria TaxID=28612 RepID=UPI0008114CEE|nr:PREDICTED: uncharacterized protein LOC108361069 [Rhagoletis zephyria]
MGRLFEMPATGRRSLRRAKRNVLQLLADSRKQIQDMFQNEESTKAKLQPNQQFLSTDTVSMMEKGKIRETASDAQFNPERRAEDILSQYNRDTTFEYEQCFTGRATNSFPIQADQCSYVAGATLNLKNKRNLQLASNRLKLNNAVALRTPEADIPNALMLAVKSNEEVIKSPQLQEVVNASGN